MSDVNDSSKAKSIFRLAVEKCGPEQWSVYLDGVCGGDARLRKQVEDLLLGHQQTGSFHEQVRPPGDDIHYEPISEGPGATVGPYKLLQKIGEGGFGVVFMAEQREPFVRKVALKIIKPGMDTREVIARFEAERQALALMDHPNIARVLDAGATGSGRPYFVMEMVRGVPITEYCDRNELPAEDRLKLFADICRAVQHAHQKGIIHRDLKPTNILVTLHDGRPAPKVIDFGVSKAISQRLTERTLFTAYGQMIGTPQYMSPEQAEMSGLDVDTRSDVYSLGVLLYEMLTGTTPLEGERFRTAGHAEMQRMIREEDPPRPSVRLSALGERLTVVARHRSTDAKRLQQVVRGELDWIVMKSLEKERGRRYESPNGLAADVERFLAGQPVEAHPPSNAYRMRKLVRRHRPLVAAVAAVSVALVLGIVGTSIGMFLARREAKQAEAEGIAADVARVEAEDAKTAADQARGAAVLSEHKARARAYLGDMASAGGAWERSNLPMVKASLERYRAGSGNEDLREWEWFYLWRLWRRNADLLAPCFGEYAFDLAVSGDGQRLALGSPYGPFATLWDLSARPPRQLRQFGKEQRVRWAPTCVALSFRGETLAYPDAEFKGLILENFETQKAVPVHFARGVTLTAVAFSPRRHVVAAATSDFRITIYDAASGEIRLAFDQHKTVIGAIAFFADSELVVSGDYDGTVLLWNAESGEVKRRLAGHTDRIYELAVTRNGNMVASASADRTVRVWDCASDASPRIANVFRDEARSVSFSPDGSLLAAGSRELLLRIWDTGTYQELEPIRGSHRPGATFLPDGRLTFASWERRQALCTLDPRTRDCALEPKGWVLDLAFSRRPGDLILAARADRAATSVNRGGKPAPTVDLYRVDKDQATRLDPLLPGFPVGCLAVSPRGTWAVGDADGARVKLFEDLTQRSAVELTAQAAQGVRGAAFSADGARLAVGFSDGRIALWRMDPQTGAWKPGKEWQAHDAAVTELAFGPTSHATLVTGGWDRTVKTWNCDAAEMAQPPRACANTIMSIAFSPSGETLAASHFDGDIDIWDGRTSDHRVLRGHGLHVESIAFLNDGRTLVSAGGDRTLKFWDLPTGRERFTVEGGVKIFTSLAISPDETVIAAGTRDGTIRLLRRATEEEVKSAGW